MPYEYYTHKSTQSTGESDKSGLEALRGRIRKLAFYGKKKFRIIVRGFGREW